MLKNVIRGGWTQDKNYELVFDDGRNSGFGFPCDAQGNVNRALMTDAAFENLQFCLSHPEKFVRFNEVVVSKWSWKEPDKGTCRCGQLVELVNEYHGACQCPKCGQWYNLFGQELLPPEEWGWDE